MTPRKFNLLTKVHIELNTVDTSSTTPGKAMKPKSKKGYVDQVL